MLRWVAAFCGPLRPVLLLVSFPRSRSPVVGVPGLCWMRRDVPFVCGTPRPPPRGAKLLKGALPPTPSPPANITGRQLACRTLHIRRKIVAGQRGGGGGAHRQHLSMMRAQYVFSWLVMPERTLFSRMICSRW